MPGDPLSGAALYEDVKAYDALGEHRSASLPDHATSAWLAHALGEAGFDAGIKSFPWPLFEPSHCGVESAAMGRVGAFPAWPVVPTGEEGLFARLAPVTADEVEGCIVVAPFPHDGYASLTRPVYTEIIDGAIDRGAIGIVAITEGSTGEIVALNSAPGAARHNTPIVLAAGRDKDRLWRSALAREEARLFCAGHLDVDAMATNVVARRRGEGRTIVVTTPKSGWFHCAGERGSGIAIFLGLARLLARETDADLLFVATAGHEFEWLGGKKFLESVSLPSETVRLWLHIGANVASFAIGTSPNGIKLNRCPSASRWLFASGDIMPDAVRAFEGQAGYETPVDIDTGLALGELEIYQQAGYRPLLGVVGSHPFHHTRLDRASVVTGPEVLEPVARALAGVIGSVLR